MSLYCYHCKTTPLLPTKLEYDLPALRCTDCQGTYIDLLSYRNWLDVHPNHTAPTHNNEQGKQQSAEADTTFNIEELTNTDNALICQRCSKFMLKYRINNEHENTINVCHTCDDVWLDRGEWALLKHLNMQNKLTDVMSEPWQQELRNQERTQAFVQLYKNLLGDDFATVEEFAKWLNKHPHKSEIYHFLSQYEGE